MDFQSIPAFHFRNNGLCSITGTLTKNNSTPQIPVSKWHEVIGEQTIADAILDRIIHESHRLELKGESMRKKNAGKDLMKAN
jgi:DNA replication protein DnaC